LSDFKPDRLENRRNIIGLTQEEVANKIGVARSTYGNYESGKREPDFKTTQKIADLFEVTVDYLLGRSDDPHTYLKSAELDEHRGKSAKITVESIDPEINVFFKDFQSAPKEKQEEMIRFWNFIKQQENGRKPGDKQGE
jgi:transcriptional regulator with XRE-family HTH domain